MPGSFSYKFVSRPMLDFVQFFECHPKSVQAFERVSCKSAGSGDVEKLPVLGATKVTVTLKTIFHSAVRDGKVVQSRARLYLHAADPLSPKKIRSVLSHDVRFYLGWQEWL